MDLVSIAEMGVFNMLSQDTADCLALANTAVLMRLIQDLSERSIIIRPKACAI